VDAQRRYHRIHGERAESCLSGFGIPSECDGFFCLWYDADDASPRYLFAHADTLNILRASVPTGSLQAFFPNLVAVFTRCVVQRSRNEFSIMTGTETHVTIYRPIRLSTLVHTSVLSGLQHITKWGRNIVQLSRAHAGEEFSTAYPRREDGCSCVPPKTCFHDDVVGLRFLADGRLLPEMSNLVSLFPVGETAWQTRFTVTFDQAHTWDDEECRDMATGLLSLIPPRQRLNGRGIPEVQFFNDKFDQIPFYPIMYEVRIFVATISSCSLIVISSSPGLAQDAHDHLFQDEHRVPRRCREHCRLHTVIHGAASIQLERSRISATGTSTQFQVSAPYTQVIPGSIRHYLLTGGSSDSR
jgi:hypothetical protein